MIYKKELDEVGRHLLKKHHNLAIAESVTAGLLQNVFANTENASLFYEGGITAYNIQQKCTHLFIDPVHAIACNCVSEKVAEEMAVGISRSFKTTWGIAVTGYASPIPEEGFEDLFACYAFCFKREIVKKATIRAEKDKPEAVQQFYVRAVLRDFIQFCTEVELI
jgi:nicotinamide-nucleotide amidase